MVLDTEVPDLDLCLLEKLTGILDLPVKNAAALEQVAQRGLRTATVHRLVARGFSQAEIDWIISPHKLLQARQASLDAEESQRLLQVTRLFCLASIVRGDEHKALSWLRKPCHSYGGLSPMDLAKSTSGAYHVELLLRQLYCGLL